MWHCLITVHCFPIIQDMMFDAVKFGVAIVTDEAFDNLEETHLKYRYSWTYDDPPQGEKAEKERSDDFLEILADYTSVTGYIPRYANQATISPETIWAVTVR